MAEMRVDMIGRLKGSHRTPQGGVRVPANLTRTGVFVYRKADGSEVRELRHPDEVFHEDSIATLETAAVTEGHPGMVDPSTWKDLSVGSLLKVRKDADKFIAADVVINDPRTIAKIDAGALAELSCGYTCEVLAESGEYNGEKYDAKQVGIRYNHVGLGPRGWGRAGGEVSLKLDGGVIAYTSDMSDDLKVRLDALTAQAKDLQAKCDALGSELAEAKRKADHEAARADSEKQRADKAEAEIAPERMDARVAARVKLHEDAKALGLEDPKGTEAEIVRAALEKADPKFKADGRSEDYLRARFDLEVDRARQAGAALGKLHTDSVNAAPAATESPLDKAIEKFRKDSLEAWKPENSASPYSKK